MERDPDLSHLLEGPGDAAGPDPLEAIVRRAARRRVRIGAAAAAVVLVAGGVGGYLLGNGGGSGHANVQVASRAPAGNNSADHNSAGENSAATNNSAGGSNGAVSEAPPATAGGGAVTGGVPGGYTYSHDLTRTTAAGVTVRTFRAAGAGAARLVEVSTDTMVGSAVFSRSTDGQPVVDVTGVDTGSPVLVVGAFTTATVAEVHWSGTGGGDATAPVNDFAALAVPVKAVPAAGAAVGTLTATDAQGHRVSSFTLRLGAPTVCQGRSAPTVTSGGAVNPGGPLCLVKPPASQGAPSSQATSSSGGATPLPTATPLPASPASSSSS